MKIFVVVLFLGLFLIGFIGMVVAEENNSTSTNESQPCTNCGNNASSPSDNQNTSSPADEQNTNNNTAPTSSPAVCGKLIYFCSEDSPYCTMTKKVIDSYIEKYSGSGCVEFQKHVISTFMDLDKDSLSLQYKISGVPTFLFINKNGCFADIGKGGGTTMEDIGKGISNFKCGSNSSTPVPQVTETVTCIFQNTDKEQKCYTAGDNNRAVCSGVGSCVADISGYQGEQITWKSSCGQYQNTGMDGNAEKISFDCSSGETNITRVFNNGFTNVYFQCYDGAESKSTDRAACKSADYWKKFASNFCATHCENDPKKCKQKYKNQEEIDKCLGKCGINSFSIGNECYLGEGATCGVGNLPPCSPEENITEISTNTSSEILIVCKDSCALDSKCYPMGYRKDSKFCSDSGGFIEQKKDEACENNFECSSNVCVNSNCISQGFMDKVLNWFKRLFG